uniref:hypothetical protein n=1 Tax=Microbacterium proteolyticum TaxID=1572644 RepID=UPI0024164068|nr:hypothetical protein [Microbacterium proteolyticum]
MTRWLSAGDNVTIPITGGITEGGLIIIGILVIVISALVVVGLVIWRFGSQIAARMKAVQDQVANDHKKPDGTPMLLRDDLDEKHDENAKKLDRALELIGTIQRDVAFLMRRSIAQEDRIDDLEDTDGRTRRTRRTDT